MNHRVVAFATVLAASSALAQSHRRGPPAGAVAWAGRSTEPQPLELTAVQQSAASDIVACFHPPSSARGYSVRVAFETSGRALWSNADDGHSALDQCVSGVIHRTMRLNPFNSVVPIIVTFPRPGSHW